MNTAQTLHVRPVRVQDMAAITAIYGTQVETSVSTYEYDRPDTAEMQRRMQAVQMQRALDDGDASDPIDE